MLHVTNEKAQPFDFRGLQIRELTPDGLQSLSVAEIEVGVEVKHETARSIKSDKLYICVEGTITFQVEDAEVKLERGDLLFIRKNEWFSYHNDGNKFVRLILIHSPPFDLESEEFLELKK